jgi:hypothetical protein
VVLKEIDDENQTDASVANYQTSLHRSLALFFFPRVVDGSKAWIGQDKVSDQGE